MDEDGFGRGVFGHLPDVSRLRTELDVVQAVGKHFAKAAAPVVVVIVTVVIEKINDRKSLYAPGTPENEMKFDPVSED